MPSDGCTIRKTTVFASCACLSFIMFTLFFVFVICTTQMLSAIQDVCKRVDASFEMMCTMSVQNSDSMDRRGFICDQGCYHDWPTALSSVGGAPPLFGVGDWTADEKPGIPKMESDTKDAWQSIVRPGESCSLSFTNGSIWQAQVDCVCGGRKGVQVKVAAAKGNARLQFGCTVVSWEGGAPWFSTSGPTPCIYIPSDNGAFRNELAVGFYKDEEIERCELAKERFAAGGHYFVIYMPIMFLWCWCGIVSIVGFLDQKYHAFKRFKAKNERNYQKEGLDEKSAVATAAEEWAANGGGNLFGKSSQDDPMYAQPDLLPAASQPWNNPGEYDQAAQVAALQQYEQNNQDPSSQNQV